MIYVTLYLGAIIAANISATYWGASASIINAFLFIGLDLTCRDKLHDQWGANPWGKMGLLIGGGGLLSYIIAPSFIAIASLASFVAAGVVDSVIYHIIRNKPHLIRINASNVASSLVDSAIFPTVAFGYFSPPLIIVQWGVKVLGGFVWSIVLNR